MDLIGFAIKNPVKVAVGVLLVLLFGAIALTTIPIQMTPDIDKPKITVTTFWMGRSPEEIEKEVIDKQEDKLKGIANLRKMVAMAQSGAGRIELEFYVGTDIDVARAEVSDKLREVPDYPDEVDQPIVNSSGEAHEEAIAFYILLSEQDGFDIEGFKDIADERIKPMIERVTGVDQVKIFGGREREVHVEIDPRLMAQRGVTFNGLIGALRQENVNVSAGDVTESSRDIRVRTLGQYDNLEDIRETIVAYDSTGPIRVKDIGDVKQTLEKRRGYVHHKGANALTFAITKESGSNVVELMERVQAKVDDINANVLPLYGGKMRFQHVYDETGYINDAVWLVKSNLLVGACLAGMVLLFFLRTFRPTVIVLLTIPISIIGTFVVMTALGRSLNVISLAGLAFAVGMVVDAAIVVLENIDRHLGMGKSAYAAAYDGAKEVWGAILASVLTTVCVFIPVIFMQEEAGQLFRDISIAICASVLLSLFVSITVIPVASSKLLKPKKEKHESLIMRQLHGLFGLAYIGHKITEGYSKALYWVISAMPMRTVMRIGIVLFFTAASLTGAYYLMPPSSYLPLGNTNFVFAMVLNPPGYSIPKLESMGRELEASFEPYWEAKTDADLNRIPKLPNFIADPTGKTMMENVPRIEEYFNVAFPGGMFMGAKSADKNNVKNLADFFTLRLNMIPGSYGFGMQAPLFGDTGDASDAIDIEIIANDMEELKKTTTTMYMALQKEFGQQTRIMPNPSNFNLPTPELQVKIDRVTAADLGIGVADVGTAVQALVDGAKIGDYRLGGETIDLKLIRSPNYDISIDNVGSVPLAVPDRQAGTMSIVPLSTIVKAERTLAPQEIKRIERRRAVSLNFTPPDGIPLETAIITVNKMKEGILSNLRASGEIGNNVEIRTAGTADKLTEVRQSLLGNFSGTWGEAVISLLTSRMFLALLVTYLLMAALFESFLYPAVIMFTVPLATVGGFMGLAIVHYFVPSQQLDVLTMLGFVILIGIVVNNAILIVHQSLNFMKGIGESEDDKIDQLDPYNAIRESVYTRMRPIFMTTATSVFGMLPLVIAGGSGSELYKGLGSVVVGGLVLATLFTLIVVPILFSLVLDLKVMWYKFCGWEMAETMDHDKAEHLLEV